MFLLPLDTTSLKHTAHPGHCSIRFAYLPFQILCYKSVLELANYVKNEQHQQEKKSKKPSSYFRTEEIPEYGVDEEEEQENALSLKIQCPSSLQSLQTIFHTPKKVLREEDEEEGETTPVTPSTPTVPATRQYRHEPIAVVLMIHGGNFAGGIFTLRNSSCIQHKTFHKYVTRKKQGKRQATHDKASHAQSAGAQIRRHNEEHFKLKTRETIDSWKEWIEMSKVIFVHVPGPYNKKMIFWEDGPLQQSDKRIKVIPFDTGKTPNFTQVQKAYRKLVSLTVAHKDHEEADQENSSSGDDEASTSKSRSSKKFSSDNSQSEEEQSGDDEDDDDDDDDNE